MRVEPWLRNTHTEIEPVRRASIHALELTREDLQNWCGQLNDSEMHQTPSGLPSVAFQIRHIAGSLDRLLTYAEGRPLNETQLLELRSEHSKEGTRDAVLAELTSAIDRSIQRLLALDHDLNETRYIGRDRLPVSLGGLIVHIADHTQRHTGQAITTAKVLLSMLGY